MDKLQTPYFLIDQEILSNYYSMLTESLSKSWGNYIVGYSFKTNSLPWLVKFVQQKGAYAEVVSDDEYQLAKHLGFKDSEIIYNGPYKARTSFEHVLTGGGIVNLDSFREIEWLGEISPLYPDTCFSVGIRVNFDLESMCPGETTMGKESGRFGFCYETGKLSKALTLLQALPNVKVTGLHLHSSSKSRSVNVFRSIARVACLLKQEFHLNLSYVDLGGGYCGGMAGRPEYPDYFPAIAAELSKGFQPSETRIIVEPGISLISKCTTFTTEIFDVRDIKGTRYVMTDGSRFNIDATMIKSSYMFHIEQTHTHNVDRKVLEDQVISGYTCMECDRLFHYENQPELIPGDRIIYENVGGYTMSLNPLFIQYFPAVYVKDSTGIKLVRKKWTPAEYVQGSILDTEMRLDS